MTALAGAQPAGAGGAWSLARFDGVRPFEHDPDLLMDVAPDVAAILRRRVVAERLVLASGPWSPPAGDGRLAGALGLLVIDGLLVRCMSVHGRDCAELVGAGDLLRPWEHNRDSLVEGESSWRVLQPTTLAVLDAQHAALLGRCPSVIVALLARSALRARDLAVHLAIAQIRQAEPRLLTLLWHLAGRWGRMTPTGVALPLPLTHELLGRLVCLHRPTTSTALQGLARAGEIARRPDRGWTLLGESPRLDRHDGASAGAAVPVNRSSR